MQWEQSSSSFLSSASSPSSFFYKELNLSKLFLGIANNQYVRFDQWERIWRNATGNLFSFFFTGSLFLLLFICALSLNWGLVFISNVIIVCLNFNEDVVKKTMMFTMKTWWRRILLAGSLKKRRKQSLGLTMSTWLFREGASSWWWWSFWWGLVIKIIMIRW